VFENAVGLDGLRETENPMQAYEVEFTPAQLPPFRIADGLRAARLPYPHVPVGDPTTAGKGVRVPLTSRLAASCNGGALLIARAGAYRDPKTGRIVLGTEQAAKTDDTRALVRLAAASSFPEGVSVTPQKEVSVLATGAMRNGQQLLLIWPDGGRILVEDPAREERYELRRRGGEFERVALEAGG
jgi:hypothetical protein